MECKHHLFISVYIFKNFILICYNKNLANVYDYNQSITRQINLTDYIFRRRTKRQVLLEILRALPRAEPSSALRLIRLRRQRSSACVPRRSRIWSDAER